MKDEIKACLIASLERILDSHMRERGFARSKASLVYKRHLGDSTQIVDLALEIHPKDRRDAAAAIYPRMEVLVPSVDQLLDEIVGDNLGLLEGITGGRTKLPIGLTSEKNHTGRWYVFQPDSIPGVVEDLKAVLDRWTIPLLDAYATPEDILAADERNDARLPRDRAQVLRVVAAALANNRPDYALAVMGQWFDAPGLRRRYQRVFDYIAQKQ